MKYRSSDIFGSVDIDTGDAPTWRVSYPPPVTDEHARLKEAVVEAARAWQSEHHPHTSDVVLVRAINSLNEFEANLSGKQGE